MRHKILQINDYQDSVFVLRMERNGLEFEPGQHVKVSKANDQNKREYSLYSSPDKDYLELLIKDVDGGDVSGELHRSRVGDELEVEGPFGTFTIPLEHRLGKLLFIATGTGIAPFHSFVTAHPQLDYQLLHGVQNSDQLYGRESFNPQKHIDCLSRSSNGGFHGRVTDYLRQNPIDTNTFCYLCGSSDMIYEVFKILQQQGIPRHHMFTEAYY